MKRAVLLLLLCGAAAPSALSGQTVIDPEKGFTLQNNYAQYVFEPRGLGLSGLIDRRTGVNHIKDVGGKHLLWEVTFGKGVMRPRIDNNFSVGQGFIDGKQVGWMDFDLLRKPEFSAKVEFLRRCAQLRMASQKFHTFGRLWGPVAPTNPVPLFEEEFRDGGLRKGKVPAVEARLWQSEDGHLALFLANYTEKEVPFSYALDPARYGLAADRFELTEILPGKTLARGREGRTITRTETMAPNTVRVIEIAPVR